MTVADKAICEAILKDITAKNDSVIGITMTCSEETLRECHKKREDRNECFYEMRKALALLCSCAINDLLINGVETVTLGACGHSAFLYEKLGFERCFNNTVMKFDF